MTRKVLCVDDDRNILQGYERQLRKRFKLETAYDPYSGLEMVKERGPFAVVVSDMRMPGMDGVQFLREVRQIAPDTVRIMLTGNADQQTAVDAVNEGHIFRFLNKPCAPEELAREIEAGLEQYRLIRAERELLSNTLSGSVRLLTDLLAMVHPATFGRIDHVRRTARCLCASLSLENAWEVELAAMLCHVGCIAVPEEILARVTAGQPLTEEQSRVFNDHPRIGASLITRIPRLQGVARIVALQLGPPAPKDGSAAEPLPLAARILKTAIDFDRLLAAGKTPAESVGALAYAGKPAQTPLLAALAKMVELDYGVRNVSVQELEDGMVFYENVESDAGELLVAKGIEVAPWIRERLAACARSTRGVRQPIRVRCSKPTPTCDARAECETI